MKNDNMKEDIFVALRERAKGEPKKIILPEGDDIRIIEAAKKIIKEKIARLIILDKGNVTETFREELNNGYLDTVNITDKALVNKYASLYFDLRKPKGLDFAVAERIIRENSVYMAALMVKENVADGFVAGASFSTTDVARAAIHCVGRQSGISTVCGAFIMVVPDSPYGEGGLFVFADCAVVPNPDAAQLADIAIETADFTRDILGIVPRVAMLSYSSKGSSTSDRINTIVEATKIAKDRFPQMLIDGELQVDAAIVPEVAKRKSPESRVAGSANVLIFPNLEAANCSYKLVQRLAKARAVGPFFLGLAKSASDLSRGCGVEDIVDAVAITVVRAQQ